MKIKEPEKGEMNIKQQKRVEMKEKKPEKGAMKIKGPKKSEMQIKEKEIGGESKTEEISEPQKGRKEERKVVDTKEVEEKYTLQKTQN